MKVLKTILGIVVAGFVAVIVAVFVMAGISTYKDAKVRAAAEVKQEKRADERQKAAAAAFQALSPDEHLDQAKAAMGSHAWELAANHLHALPDGHPQKAPQLSNLSSLKANADREDPGPRPDTMVMTYALTSQIKAALHDPDSLQGPDLSDPVKDTIIIKGKKVSCWRVGVQFRAKNGFGALRLTQGTIWMKNNESIKESL